ncbi:retrovirus-related pol polyprotein from transposon TNT 1-94, partial [Tanacetum coccineum]
LAAGRLSSGQTPTRNCALCGNLAVTMPSRKNKRARVRTRTTKDNQQVEDVLQMGSNRSDDEEVQVIQRKRVRGPTFMPKVWTKSDEDRISVSFNEYGQPIDKKTTSTLTHFMGSLAMSGKYCPLHKSWPKVGSAKKKTLLDALNDKFDLHMGCDDWILKSFGNKKSLRGIAYKPQSMSDEDWLGLDEKALATIQLFLTREVFREVIHETTTAGLWLKLESLYMTKSLANKLRLKDRLYTFCMKPGTSVQDHLDEFNTILIDLENLDVDIDNEDKAVLLVISLTSSYKHFKEIMLYGNRKTLSFDDVKSALLSKQKYDDDVEPESGEGLLKNKLEREGKRNNKKKPEKPAEVAITKGDFDGDIYLAIDIEKSKDELIVDSGCTFHMIPHRSWFTTYESFNGGNIYIGNHSICPVIGKGNIQVKMHNGVVRTIAGYSGEGGVMKIFKGALVLMKAIQSGGLYVLQGTVVYSTAGVATSKASLDDSKLLHYRLGHMGEKGMKYLAKKGLIKVSCIERGMLLTTFILIYGGHPLLRLEEHKDEVFPTFKEWKMLIENQTGKKIKKLRTDNGLEFCGEKRMNRTIMEKERCMLSHANLDKDFWVEAATTASYLINRSPHISLDGNIPEILWSGNSVDYSNLRVFGCTVYVHVNEGKLVPRVVKCIFLGYGSGVKGYRVWCPNPKYRKIIHSRDVTFNEDVIINSDDGNMPTSPQSQPQTEYLLARDRERRQVNRPPKLKDYQCDLVAYAFSAVAHIEGCKRTNYFEAISSPECDK